MKTNNTHELAARILLETAAKNSYNNLALKHALSENAGLTKSAKAAVTDIVNGALRNLIYIDLCIQAVSSVPPDKLKPFVLSVLRAGAYEILFTQTPPRAACNEAVNTVKNSPFKNLAGFVNAVLRNIARRKGDPAFPGLPDAQADPTGRICAEYSCPRWLAEYWLSEFDIDTVRAVCAGGLKPPRVTVCVNALKTDKPALARELRAAGVAAEENTRLADSLYISGTSDLSALPAFKNGLFHVMDESAMLAVRLAGPAEGETLLDVCAAPGGKSFYAAYLTGGGRVRAFDIHEHKIRLMAQSAERLGLPDSRPRIKDARVFDAELENAADCLILDAPCSGFGLLRKKPDIKYNKTMRDVEELAAIQRGMLANCHKYVKPGGRLLYSTCTISARENADNMRWFAANFPFIETEYDENELRAFDCRKMGMGAQILPGPDADGFYICCLKRMK